MTNVNDSPTGSFRQFVFRAQAQSTGKMRKEGRVDILPNLEAPPMLSYEIACDESTILGGEDSAPPPLAYFTASIAFCLMTQISRYAHMRNLHIHDLKMTTTVHYHNEGSVLQGSIQGIVDSVESTIEVDSTESEATIQQLIRDAEAGCYVHYALTQPVTVTNQIVYRAITGD